MRHQSLVNDEKRSVIYIGSGGLEELPTIKNDRFIYFFSLPSRLLTFLVGRKDALYEKNSTLLRVNAMIVNYGKEQTLEFDTKTAHDKMDWDDDAELDVEVDFDD